VSGIAACVRSADVCLVVYYTEEFNEMYDTVVQLSEIGTLVELMKVSTLELVAHIIKYIL
jgi:hypothetical protein